MAFQPVPTYQDPVEVDPRTGKSQFNPTWLSWFLTLSQGGLSTTIQHNSTLGLQGGVSGQYYHLSSTQLAAIPFRTLTAPVGITVTASPFTYVNGDGYDEDIVIYTGTISALQFKRGTTTVSMGTTQGMYRLSPGDALVITYSSLPTLTKISR